jgi:hypothetical protein
LFTDLVDSTRIASEMGDRRWRELLGRHHRIVRQQIKRSGGRELDNAGDGFFAQFGDPAAAISCACAAADAVQDLGVSIRAGVHLGDCEVIGRKLTGVTVVVGSRVMALGGASEVLVSGTVKDVVAGARFGFEPRGVHELKGVDGSWPIFAVSSVDGKTRAPPLSQEEAAARRGVIEPGGSGRRSRWGAAAAAFVLLIVAALAYFARGSGSLSSVPPGSVALIDPETGSIIRATNLGRDVGPVLSAANGVWVARTASELVERVDPAGVAPPEPFTPGCHPTNIVQGDTSDVWVLCGFDAQLVRINLTKQPTVSPAIDLPGGGGYTDLTFDGQLIWATDALDGWLVRVDPSGSGGPQKWKLPDCSEPFAVTAGNGDVWVLSGDVLCKVMPGPTGPEAVDAISLQWSADDASFGAGAVWIIHALDDKLTRVSAELNETTPLDVGNQPQSVVVGANHIWVSNYLSESLSRVDPAAMTVEPINIGARPWAVSAGPSGVWVSVPG